MVSNYFLFEQKHFDCDGSLAFLETKISKSKLTYGIISVDFCDGARLSVIFFFIAIINVLIVGGFGKGKVEKQDRNLQTINVVTFHHSNKITERKKSVEFERLNGHKARFPFRKLISYGPNLFHK